MDIAAAFTFGCEIIAEYSIETIDLSKKFVMHKRVTDLILRPLQRKEFTSLDSVSLKVREGEVFGIIGPNGAGKTTLIKILCTLISPTSGNAYVNGYDVVSESSKVRQSLGLVTTDERSFYWRLTGRQNLEFFATLHNFYSGKSRDRVNEVLDIVRLKDKADELFMGYSAGMKQRMAIARGLLNDPLVLFMDEPTRSLDPGAAQNLRDFIKNYIVKEQGKTIFLSTHNLEEAEQLCHRIAIFDEGKIKATGSSQDLKKGLGDGATLRDAFSAFTGKHFIEETLMAGPRFEKRFGRRGGFGMGGRRL
ncbi:MAG: putative ABC transporter ATP-binding protein [Methanosaeta sp. PtaB.Bin018]|nr:MAG: putative ABC transporter ATP-binding protein [Methanosaeta sp. PtaB.Bin018]